MFSQRLYALQVGELQAKLAKKEKKKKKKSKKRKLDEDENGNVNGDSTLGEIKHSAAVRRTFRKSSRKLARRLFSPMAC